MRGKWIPIICVCVIVMMLTGCQTNSVDTLPKEEGKQMSQEEKKQLKDKAVQHIKSTYNKEFVVTKVECVREFNSNCFITGNVKDENNTEITVYWMPPEIKDDYVLVKWDQELEPKIKEISNKHFEIKRIETISYTNGTKTNKYTGEIPSVYEVLKNGGDKDYLFKWTGEIYKNGGKYEQSIKNFLEEIEEMNFNRVRVTIYVYDDQLKTSTTKEDEGKYLLYEYVISIDDIQKAEIDSINLNQYKTVY
ncbi:MULTISPECIES: hypothetical protein [Thermoactinomyces]|uniref:Lipoprotein n=3 Tax=Thermoactinomyces TaxID=2023 RepID=A0A8I1DFD0_THEIN|nr:MULTISPECIES: hypothetical protein [Thermoactinomyces]MBA4552014.1 hypothetical protein [Thermoactinomyces vulgaris]MBA4597496.1 hypothetical protein [Thermoactinomyces vulgaris]MBA4835044.1 hypothetical protein [Thermoactinomyces intermedius]MBH8587196.1 hypothetical protein [Thermoactinomyces sp. CICC 10520]MBH8588958.1 hypothetical protein [Thermoactinomyces vulgaris]